MCSKTILRLILATPLFAAMPAFAASSDFYAVGAIGRSTLDASGGSIDAVAAAEARGFIFGAPVALALNVPFVPIRKPGKLPFEKIGILDRIAKRLEPDGYLTLGAAETVVGLTDAFKPHNSRRGRPSSRRLIARLLPQPNPPMRRGCGERIGGVASNHWGHAPKHRSSRCPK